MRDPLALGGSFLGLVLLAVLIVEVIALVDASIRPKQGYVAAGKQTKTFWVLILGLAVAADVLLSSLFLTLVGTVAAIVYLVDARPAVREASRGRGRGGTPGPFGPW